MSTLSSVKGGTSRSRRPSILLVVGGASGRGGMEGHVVHLAQGLSPGFDCVVACLSASESYLDRLKVAGIAFENLGIPVLRTGSAVARSMRRVATLVRTMRPDIVHLYGFECDLWAPLVRCCRPSAIILSSRRSEDPHDRHHRMRRYINRFCNGIVCVSDETAAHAVRKERLSRGKIVTIPNGVRIPSQVPSRMSSGRLRFGTLGNVKPVKGTDLLIEAFKKFPSDADVELCIAGSMDGRNSERQWRETLSEQALAQGAAGRVAFLGFSTEPAAFLDSLDVFVLPSRSEGMSNALLEAMAMGLPCIATDVGSNRSVLCQAEGDCAGLVCEVDSDSLFDAMSTLLAHPQLRNTLGERARRRVVEHFSLETMVHAYSRLYRDLLTSRSHARGGRPTAVPSMQQK